MNKAHIVRRARVWCALPDDVTFRTLGALAVYHDDVHVVNPQTIVRKVRDGLHVLGRRTRAMEGEHERVRLAVVVLRVHVHECPPVIREGEVVMARAVKGPIGRVNASVHWEKSVRE
jgi:hypothetical protein